MVDKYLKGSIKVNLTLSATASVKTNFSGHHMVSAAHFARQSAIIETNYKDEITDEDELRAEHRAYVTGAIIVSVASLEATINEVFISARDNDSLFKGFDHTTPKALKELFDIVERSKILQKYQFVLIAANKEVFDCGNSPYLAVDCLIKLRNALVHYKPEWDTDSKKPHKSIEDCLTCLAKMCHLHF